jgi:deoxyribonuclease IV
MPLLGAHMSIAGGLHMAFQRIRDVQGEALQLFTKSERQWNAPALEPSEVEIFHRYWEENGRMPVGAHDTYLINLAAPDPVKLERSVLAFAEELRRSASLGIPFLITHPGSHLGEGVEPGLERFVANLDRAIELSETSIVEVLLETTAGQGTNLGATFEEIAYILNNSRYTDRLGICFDTCHAFAAGYDLRTPEAYERTFRHLDETIGLERLKFFHVNDSKKGLGSRVDRHEHIGKGTLGLEAFRLLLNDPRFKHHPMVLETHKEKDLALDRENLAVLRSLLQTG